MAIDNKIILDFKETRYEVQSASTYPSADVSQTVNGVLKIEVDTLNGNGYSTYYDNTDFTSPNYTIPIDGVGTVGAISNDVFVLLASDSSGAAIKGNYRITFTDEYLVGASPTTEAQEILFTYSKSVDLTSCLTSQINCAQPVIVVQDEQTFVWESVTPTFETSELTLVYPETSNQPNLFSESVPFEISTNNVWTKGYSASSEVIALYDFTTYLERIEVKAELAFEVECLALCDILPCLDSLKAEMDAAYGVNSGKYEKLNEAYTQAMAIAAHVNINISCGQNDNTSTYIKEIKNIINNAECKCTCPSTCDSTTSEKVRGSFNDPLSLEYAYLGVGGTTPTNSAEVLALTQTLIQNEQVTLNTGAVETKFKVCLPPGKVIQSVSDTTYSAQGINITSEYLFISMVDVVIDSVAYPYSVYEMNTAVPYSEDHTHVVSVTSA